LGTDQWVSLVFVGWVNWAAEAMRAVDLWVMTVTDCLVVRVVVRRGS